MKANRMNNKASSEGKRKNLNHLKIGMKPRKMLKDIFPQRQTAIKGKHRIKMQSCQGQEHQLSGHTASSTENRPRGGLPFLQSLGNCL